MFAGAIVLPTDKPDVFEIGRHPIAEAEVQDGRVVRLLWRDGEVWQVGWQKLRDLQVPATLRIGDGKITVKYKRLNATWTVPEQIRLQGLWGTASGPADAETIKLSRLKTE